MTGKTKQGAACGYTKVLGYHPILATRADTGEVCHARMRKGSANTARGARRFIDELVPRLRRAGASGEIVMRFDSGFWSKETIATLRRLDVRYTMAVRTNTAGIAAAIAAIDPDAWVDIDYTADGVAQVAECTYQGRRLIVRRTRLIGAAQRRLWPDWRHFGFLTDLDGEVALIDEFHRDHATVELAIRDLKEGRNRWIEAKEHAPIVDQILLNEHNWLCTQIRCRCMFSRSR
ncbi:MAG: transposase [Actinobacteria bacterium]|nr:transposase [Actinomycetota bacterium]